MKVHPAGQGSLEWMQARAGIPTASEWDQILTPEFAIRKGEMPKTYLAKKVAEAWLGGPLPGFNVWDTDQGHLLEEEAIPAFEFQTGIQVQRVGLITTDDGLVGCSPDGLIGEDSGIECKCPAAQTHVSYVLAGVLPKDYAVQVHGSMFVTQRPTWKFLSYRRRFPSLILDVERDDEIQEKIAEALALFLGQFKAAMARMAEINGGPPFRAPQPKSEPVTPKTNDDLIP